MDRLEMATLRASWGRPASLSRSSWRRSRARRQCPVPGAEVDVPSDSWLSLSLNLRVGGERPRRPRRRGGRRCEGRAAGGQVRKAISDQVDAAAVTYRAATAALEAAGERREASLEAYRQVDRAYRVGEATTLDLLDATTEATDAANTLIIAKAQRQFQAIALRHAIGLPPLPDLDPSSPLSEEPTP
jgi:outer membrane protein TolC